MDWKLIKHGRFLGATSSRTGANYSLCRDMMAISEPDEYVLSVQHDDYYERGGTRLFFYRTLDEAKAGAEVVDAGLGAACRGDMT